MTDSGFSFLKLMGREPALQPTLTVDIKNQTEKPVFEKPILLKLISCNDSLEILKKALKTGILDETTEKHVIFAVDLDDIRSVVSSFRQHNLNHLQQNWKKYRDSFVKISKKRRKLALKESRTGKSTNFSKYYSNQNGKKNVNMKHDAKQLFDQQTMCKPSCKPKQKQHQLSEDGQ